jgi:hypothetical protein
MLSFLEMQLNALMHHTYSCFFLDFTLLHKNATKCMVLAKHFFAYNTGTVFTNRPSPASHHYTNITAME